MADGSAELSYAVSIIHAVITGATSIGVMVLGFAGKRFIAKVDGTDARLTQHEKDDVGKYATIDQLTRVHSRIDDFDQKNQENFREVRQGIDGIKNILLNGAHK